MNKKVIIQKIFKEDYNRNNKKNRQYFMIDYKDYINNIHHFPIEGIIYRDIQPILARWIII